MKLRTRQLALLLAATILTLGLTLAGCDNGGSKASANTRNPNDAELFTVPPEQMSHVQVVKVQPTTLTRVLRLTGAVAYNGFRTTPVISQVSGPVSRIVVVSAPIMVSRFESVMSVTSPSATLPVWENSDSRRMTTRSKASFSCSEATRPKMS